MYKLRCFTDYDSEEKWLSRMAEQGYQLKSTAFGYTFSPAPPEKSVIRIDYRTFATHKDFIDYCALFEDSGWRHIAGTRHSGAQYFKKIGPDGSDDIFSDSLSRAGRYKRLSNMWLSVGVVWIPFLPIALNSDWMTLEGFYHPKALYLTPGLWEMDGFAFWSHFLFETPFALFRGFSVFFWMAIIGLYLFYAFRSWRLYKQTLREDESRR